MWNIIFYLLNYVKGRLLLKKTFVYFFFCKISFNFEKFYIKKKIVEKYSIKKQIFELNSTTNFLKKLSTKRTFLNF